jgi:biopolymer transport protein ExbD
LQSKKNRLIAAINITPFTDVVLVLLIIFMVATPLIVQSGFGVNIPRASRTDRQPPRNIVIAVDAGGTVYLENRQVTQQELAVMLAQALKRSPDATVLVLADKDVRYQAVIQVLDTAKAAGASRLSLGVEEQRKGRRYPAIMPFISEQLPLY